MITLKKKNNNFFKVMKLKSQPIKCRKKNVKKNRLGLTQPSMINMQVSSRDQDEQIERKEKGRI